MELIFSHWLDSLITWILIFCNDLWRRHRWPRSEITSLTLTTRPGRSSVLFESSRHDDKYHDVGKYAARVTACNEKNYFHRFYGAIRYLAVDSYRCRKLCFPLHVGTKFSSSFQNLSPFSDEGLMDNISNSMLNSKLNPLKGETRTYIYGFKCIDRN